MEETRASGGTGRLPGKAAEGLGALYWRDNRDEMEQSDRFAIVVTLDYASGNGTRPSVARLY